MKKAYTHFKCLLFLSMGKKYARLNLVTEECHIQKSDWCFVPCGGELTLAALEWGAVNECFLSSWSAASMRETGSLPVSSPLFSPSFPIFSSVYCQKEWRSFRKTTSAVSSRNWTQAWARDPKDRMICSSAAGEDAGDLTWIRSDCSATRHLAWNVVVQQPCDS